MAVASHHAASRHSNGLPLPSRCVTRDGVASLMLPGVGVCLLLWGSSAGMFLAHMMQRFFHIMQRGGLTSLGMTRQYKEVATATRCFLEILRDGNAFHGSCALIRTHAGLYWF